MVAVTQAEDDLFAPARAQMWRLLAVFGLIAVFVLAIAIWFSLRLAAPPVGTDTHITEHPEVPRIEQDA
jgi:anti-sigma-K factor RskA